MDVQITFMQKLPKDYLGRTNFVVKLLLHLKKGVQIDDVLKHVRSYSPPEKKFEQFNIKNGVKIIDTKQFDLSVPNRQNFLVQCFDNEAVAYRRMIAATNDCTDKSVVTTNNCYPGLFIAIAAVFPMAVADIETPSRNTMNGYIAFIRDEKKH